MEDSERRATHLAQEPGDNVTKDDSLVGLVVVGRRRDTGKVPEIGFPLVHSEGQTAQLDPSEFLAYRL